MKNQGHLPLWMAGEDLFEWCKGYSLKDSEPKIRYLKNFEHPVAVIEIFLTYESPVAAVIKKYSPLSSRKSVRKAISINDMLVQPKPDQQHCVSVLLYKDGGTMVQVLYARLPDPEEREKIPEPMFSATFGTFTFKPEEKKKKPALLPSYTYLQNLHYFFAPLSDEIKDVLLEFSLDLHKQVIQLLRSGKYSLNDYIEPEEGAEPFKLPHRKKLHTSL